MIAFRQGNPDPLFRNQTEQTQGVEQLNKAVAEMDKVTRQNAANAEVLKSQADEMRFVLKQLMAMVDGKNGQVRLGIRPHPTLSVKPCPGLERNRQARPNRPRKSVRNRSFPLKRKSSGISDRLLG